VLIYVDLGGGRHRLGGSALAHVFGQIGDDSPDLEDVGLLARTFDAVQRLIADGLISAGHDRSDGGLVTTVLEMAFAGNCGVDIDVRTETGESIGVLFSEELGLVIEVAGHDLERVSGVFSDAGVPFAVLGSTLEEPDIRIRVDGAIVLEADMRDLRDTWEATSFELDRLQAEPRCVAEERDGLRDRSAPPFELSFAPKPTPPAIAERSTRPRVAILREEGSNGDREMAAAFHLAGFETWDVSTSDLLAGRTDLRRFRGIATVGGFSYADVLDSAKGWAGAIRFNDNLWRQFGEFVERPDTFSLGICNGCQLFALLGWVPWRGIEDRRQPRFIRNASGRFESRFVALKILSSPSIMLRGMEGSTLGVWLQHGEGRAFFPDASILAETSEQGLAPVRFVDDDNNLTESYPFNPNGSPQGIAGLTTPDGRHLAMMPHPERTALPWNWGWMPRRWRTELEVSPWLRLFQNAREWCEEG
jgi:phosphoribosylformylglycinamidine synthase